MRFNKSIIQIKNDEARPALAVAACCLSTWDLPPVIPRVPQATDRAIIRNSPFIEHIANEKPSYPAFHFWMNINPNFRFVAIRELSVPANRGIPLDQIRGRPPEKVRLCEAYLSFQAWAPPQVAEILYAIYILSNVDNVIWGGRELSDHLTSSWMYNVCHFWWMPED